MPAPGTEDARRRSSGQVRRSQRESFSSAILKTVSVGDLGGKEVSVAYGSMLAPAQGEVYSMS